MERTLSATIDLKHQMPESDTNKYITEITDKGINVHPDKDNGWKVQISDGVYILDPNNDPINQMTNRGNTMGYDTGMHTVTDQDSIEFYDGENNLGYIGNNKLLFASAEITSNLYVTDKYVWRKTPQGAMGLYLR